MLPLVVIVVAVVLAVAAWVYFGSELRHRTELKLDTFELTTARERWWRAWRISREQFVRPTHLTTTARAVGGAAGAARVLVDHHQPGLRGYHGTGRHLVQLMNLRDGRGGFAAWAQQHPTETARLLRLFAGRVAGRGAEEAAQQLRELLVVGAANDYATFSSDIDAHLP